MNTAVKAGLGVAGGYVLGRRRKLRYAIGLGAFLVGRKVPLSPRALAQQGVELARKDPEVKELVEELRDTVTGVGRRAVRTVIEDRAGALTDRLQKTGPSSRRDAEAEDVSDEEPYPDDAEPEKATSRSRARRGSGEES